MRSFFTRNRDSSIACGLSLAFFGLYLATLCPTVYWYDSAEYAGAAYTLGIPHPPGYPLYTLLGALFALLPFEPAYSVNLMSAVFAGVAVGLAFLLSRRGSLGLVASLVGASTLGASRLFWSQAVIAEVYTTTLAILLVVLLLLERGVRTDRARPVLLASFVAGLGLGVHLSIATFGVGFVVLVFGVGTRIRTPRELTRLFRRERIGRQLAVGAGCLFAAALGGCIFLYLPLRASMKPALMMADPSTWDGFWWLVRGGNYVNWFLKDYAWLQRAELVGGILYDQLLVIGSLLAAGGVVFWFLRAPLFALALLLAAAGNLWFFFDYNVHDLEVFFLPAVLALCLFVGAGAEGAFALIARVATPEKRRVFGAVARALALAFPLSLVAANYAHNDLSGETSARDFGERLARELPEGAVILNMTTPPEWRKDAVFAKYFQLVLRQRRDVRVLAAPHPRTVIDLLARGTPVYAYEPEPRIAGAFVLRPEGDLYRLLKLRGRPQGSAR